MEFEALNRPKRDDDSNDTETGFEVEIVDETEVRPRWNSRTEYLLALIGYTVGIGSIWRFPFLCARNGGGAFLIPYFIFMALCGGPLYYMEMCLGQFSGRSAAKAFEFCPLFRGIGYLMATISFNVMWYYMNIMAWVLYFFIHCFYPTLPWTTCGNWWNTEHCTESYTRALQPNTTINCGGFNITTNTSSPCTNTTGYSTTSMVAALNTTSLAMSTNTTTYSTAVFEFWSYNVLRVSSGIEDMGAPQLHLVLACFVGWVIMVLTLIKGVHSLGKVVYVTATAPYILLTILFIRGLTLEGGVDGIIWYITPDFIKLAQPQVWIEAAIQVFFTLGPTYGGVITMASHNPFKQNIAIDAIICVFTDAFTAFYAGLVVFTCIGFIANDAGLPLATVAKTTGVGLVFVTFPEALSRMPLPQLWAVLFFFTLIMVAFDSAFGMFETVTGALIDTFPKQLTKHSTIVLVVTAVLMFLSSLPLATKAGIYIFTLFDWYVCAFVFLLAASLEAVMVSWIYGAERFSQDITMMNGTGVGKILRILWCIVIPVLLLFGFVITTFTYTEPTVGEDGYIYPRSAIAFGLFISITPFIPFLGFMVYEIAKAKGSMVKRISKLLQSSKDWRPHDEEARTKYRVKPYQYETTLRQRIKTNLLGDETTHWIWWN